MMENVALASFGTRAWADSFAPWYRIDPVHDGRRNEEDETGQLGKVRWLSRSTHEPHWVVLLFPGTQWVSLARIYWPRERGRFLKPERYWLECWREGRWQACEETSRVEHEDGQYTEIRLRPLSTDRIRLYMPQGGGACGGFEDMLGVSEFEVYSPSPRRGEPSTVIVLESRLDSRANPFLITWMPIPGALSYAVQYGRTPAFEGNDVETLETTRNYAMPRRAIEPGRWYCRVAPVLGSGRGEWSNAMQIDVGEVRYCPRSFGLWTGGHPRLPWVPRDRARLLSEIDGPKGRLFRALIDKADKASIGHVAQLRNMQSHADEAEALPEEPPPFDRGIWQIERWREIVAAGAKVLEAISLYAYAYAATGDVRYRDQAKKWLLHAASWDPLGSTGIDSVDHAAHDVLVGLSIGYDALYGELTEAERRAVRQAMEARLRALWRYLNPFVLDETNNHPWFQTNALAIGALALWDEVEKAKEWVEFAVLLYVGRFLALGGADGDWHEGSDYWTYTMGFVIEFVEAVRAVTGLDLSDHPWLHQTAAYKLYTAPPGAPVLTFGDTHKRPAGSEDAAILFYLAGRRRDALAQWYALAALEQEEPVRPGLLIRLMMWWDPSIPAQAPENLPNIKAFREVGVVIARTTLKGPDGTHFAFKSGPYHGVLAGHEHADQNSFILHADGEPMIIDSGRYDYYGSPHYYGWYIRTEAHNTLMVDGEGQLCQRPGADGKLMHVRPADGAVYFAGDATKAYGGLVDRFVRHGWLFLAREGDAGDLGLLVLFDDVAVDKARTIGSRFHFSLVPSLVKNEGGERRDGPIPFVFQLAGERAAMRLHVHADTPLVHQLEKGYPPSSAPSDGSLDEYHLAFFTSVPAASFTALYVVDLYRRGTSPAEVRFVDTARAVVTKGEAVHTFLFRRKETGAQLEHAGWIASAASLVMSEAGYGSNRLWIMQAQSVRWQGKEIFKSSQPVDLLWKDVPASDGPHANEELILFSTHDQTVELFGRSVALATGAKRISPAQFT
ncbi:MAG: hypothetical protein BSOLF_1677 [Candidatus Carbobacillus altaicus]|uniref:Uncharacterized protein n=1 Tax=Candidatus Carbonibacillus altaicus TaxID=2163959 RepID=A0A2R6Y3V6_9BACL|nr:MAG: hypothetical protein BSOLF_1677 [Candidatus Carbobacillus altaicus]